MLNYAKNLRQELQEYHVKMESAEQTSKELHESGNASIESLDAMVLKKERNL